jgi:ribonuclease R
VGPISVTPKGYAFVDTPEGTFFVPRGSLYGAMNGDLVEVVRVRRLENQQNRQGNRQKAQSSGGSSAADAGADKASASSRKDLVGAVQRVLERAQATLIGVVRVSDGLSRVIPDDERCPYDIFLDLRHKGCAVKEGDVVVVRITTYPSRREAAQGYVEEVLGHESDQGMDMAVIIRKHGFETVFSADALAEADALLREAESRAVPLSPEGELERRDLRDRLIFTIDPHDARDFDDALSLDHVEGFVRLGVHIADVSAYVAWGSALDTNARRRATSVYLPDRVIPMLPPALADDLCSLRPCTDRLAFTVDMYLNKDAVVERAEFYPSLIHSKARLAYNEVQEMLEDAERAFGEPQRQQSAEQLALLQ